MVQILSALQLQIKCSPHFGSTGLYIGFSVHIMLSYSSVYNS